MPVFVCKLVPPRPDFATSMSDAEAAAMAEHMAYWQGLLGSGSVLVYGPVADPDGVYGLAVVEAADGEEIDRLTAADPAIRAELGLRYHVAPMLQAMTGRHDAGAAGRPI